MSEAAFYDKLPEIIEKDDIGELYTFYDSYIEHLKYESRKRH